MPICAGKCKRDLPSNAFGERKAKGTLQPYCKKCAKEYAKSHYADNKQRYVDKATSRRKRVVPITSAWLNELKSGPCTDCKGTYHPVQMDFDHLSDKKFTIARRKDLSRESLLREIAKCELVCSNCHRLRTYVRKHGAVAQLAEASVLEADQ